jgi:hypothetical protein
LKRQEAILIHVSAFIGIALLIMLPISVGMSLCTPMRARHRVKMFFAAPFALLIGAMLISFGWGDWPEILGRCDGYLEAATILGCLGVVLDLVAQVRRAK